MNIRKSLSPRQANWTAYAESVLIFIVRSPPAAEIQLMNYTLSRLALVLGLLLSIASLTSAQTSSTVVGNGMKGYSGDGGPAAAAQVNNPYAVARGPDGLIYICDVDNQRVRRIEKDGTITTYAGNGQKGYAGDGGPAKQAALTEPYEMAWDKAGNLYFVERMNHIVRRVDARTQIISTVAGTGKAGFGGDGGPGPMAQLNQPHSLAFDATGQLLVCDILNHRVRKIDIDTGIITTWSGTGEKKTAPDGSPITGSSLHGPRAMALASDGKIWLALREGNAVLQMDPKANLFRLARRHWQIRLYRERRPCASGPPCQDRSVSDWTHRATSIWLTLNRIPFA